MLGYELYRQLANKKPRKRKSKGFDDQEEKQERRILAGKNYFKFSEAKIFYLKYF